MVSVELVMMNKERVKAVAFISISNDSWIPLDISDADKMTDFVPVLIGSFQINHASGMFHWPAYTD